MITELKDSYLEYHKFKYPSVPDYARVFPSYFSKLKTTNGLTKGIICAIRLKGWQGERISSSGRYVDNSKTVTNVLGMTKKVGSGKWIKSTSENGTADISASIQGKNVKIEVKNAKTKDRMSESQKLYKRKIELSGGIYMIATNIEDFLTWLEQFPDNPQKFEVWEEFGV